jgi:hypothetical protein
MDDVKPINLRGKYLTVATATNWSSSFLTQVTLPFGLAACAALGRYAASMIGYHALL